MILFIKSHNQIESYIEQVHWKIEENDDITNSIFLNLLSLECTSKYTAYSELWWKLYDEYELVFCIHTF